MKKISVTFVLTTVFLLIASLVGYFAKYLFQQFWWAFGVASAVLALGVLVLTVAKKNRHNFFVAVYIVNAVAMGLYLRSWYILRGFTENSLWLMLAMSLAAVLYFALFLLPQFIPWVRNNYSAYLVGYIIVSLAVYVLLLCFTKTTWVSTLGFYGLLQMGAMVALSLFDENENHWAFVALCSSYSVFVCALIILLVAVGGDLDLDFGGGVDIGSVRSPVAKGKRNGK